MKRRAGEASSLTAYFTESRVLFLLIAVVVLVYANSLSGRFSLR